jgi:YHS domain-containing protein
MIRFVVMLLVSVLLITVVRSVIGIVLKGFAEMFGGASGPGAGAAAHRGADQKVPLAGELKRDPVCGTYVSTATSIKKTQGGQVLHFCSIECRDKHKV